MDPQALDLATKTLAEAIDSLMAKGSPFLPIVLVESGGVRQLHRVVAERVEEAAGIARDMAVSHSDADATAFAVDGVISYNGARHDGIIVEAWNFHTSRGARVGLRYEMKGALRKKPSLLGSPLHLGRQGWYDPEEGVPSPQPQPQPMVAFESEAVPPPVEIAPVNVAPVEIAPVELPPVTFPPVDLSPAMPPANGTRGFGPPPSAESLAPADVAPPPPPSVQHAEDAHPVDSLFDSVEPAGPATPVEPEVFPELPSLPRAFGPPSVVALPATMPTPPSAPTPPPVHDFGPPPVAYSAPVAPPAESEPILPESEVASSAIPTVPEPLLTTAPPTAAHPIEGPSTPVTALSYTPVPLPRTETPLGNRAMFAGIMELATKGRSFPAFAIVQKEGTWEQVTMSDANLADTAASVRAYARSRTDADFIAFAVDTYVPVAGVDVTAVVVEVWEYATRVSFSVAQRYIPTGDPPSPRLSGRPLMRTQAGWVDVSSSMMLGGQVQFGYRDPESP